MDNLTKLYRIRKTCLEMLNDRQYLIGQVSFWQPPCAAYHTFLYGDRSIMLPRIAAYNQSSL